EQAISRLECREHGGDAIFAAQAHRAQADGRKGRAVVERVLQITGGHALHPMVTVAGKSRYPRYPRYGHVTAEAAVSAAPAVNMGRDDSAAVDTLGDPVADRLVDVAP